MLDHPETLTSAFVSKYADGKNFTNVEKMNLRNTLAKTLLNTTYSHLKEGLNARAGKQYQADMEEWNLSLPNISSAKDVARYVKFHVPKSPFAHFGIDRARDTLFDAVHPLLQAIGSYAGCYVSLIAGNAEKDDTDQGFFTA